MTSREKVLNLEAQVRAIADGAKDCLECPFCGLGTTPETECLCCEEAAVIVDAVLEYMEHIKRADVIERAMDRLAAMESSSLIQ